MKLNGTLVPLAELREIAHDRQRDFWDVQAPANKLRLDTHTGHLFCMGRTIGASWSHPLQEQALDQLAVKLGVPCAYLRKCPPELKALNVNHWIEAQGSRDLLLRFDRDEVRAIVSDRYRPVSNAELVDQVWNRLNHPDAAQCRFEANATRFVAQVLTEPLDRMGAVVGDVLAGGLNIANSETGHAPVAISSMVYRLLCSNGLIAPKETSTWSRRHIGRPEGWWETLTSRMNEAITGSRTLKASFEASREIAVDDPIARLESLSERFNLTDTEQEAVIEAFHREPGATVYALTNAVTGAAHDHRLSLEQREALMRLGGQVLQFEMAA